MEEKMNKGLLEIFKVLPDTSQLFEGMSLPEQREMLKSMFGENPFLTEHHHVYEEIAPSGSGTHSIRLVIYEPKVKNETLPGILYIHGGGFVNGAPEVAGGLCCQIVTKIPSVIVSVDYRYAPENHYPAQLEDCYDGLVWFKKNAEKLGVDKDRIGVMGESSGGGLTAALSLLARDRKGPEIAFQMPLYPMLDDRQQTQSSQEITDPRVWNAYLNNIDRDNVPIYAAPARAKDYSGLPPTYTFVGDLDPFRDETIEYISNLTKAGVPTEFHLFPGCFHAFENYAPDAEISKRAIDNFFKILEAALDK